MRNVFALAVLPASVLTAGIVSAQSTTPWDGFYLGASLGGENTKFCSSSVLTGLNIDPATSTFTRRSSGGLVGGLQFGENFQIKRLVLGIGLPKARIPSTRRASIARHSIGSLRKFKETACHLASR
jgi:hypothetical protein